MPKKNLNTDDLSDDLSDDLDAYGGSDNELFDDDFDEESLLEDDEK